MAINKHRIKSCCGGQSWLYETDTPVKKNHIDIFKQKGYSSPDHFAKAGLFYVQIRGLVATSSFGNRKIQIKVSGKDIGTLLDNFEKVLDELTKSLDS